MLLIPIFCVFQATLVLSRSIREAGDDLEVISKRTGRLVKEWNENQEENPEELGNYIEGDIVSFGKSGLANEKFRWKDGVIPFEIKGNFDAYEMQTIEAAIRLYQNHTCLRWVPHTSEKSFVRITSENSGCWSAVGHSGGPQQLNLQAPACLKRIGTVVHEMMHAIGFFHEQTRPDRDDFVKIMYGNIKFGHEHNFDKSKEKVDDFNVGYDYGSVMHYSKKAFSRNGQDTIVPKKKGAEIGQRKGFSKMDIEKINRMYNCNKE